MDLALTAEPGLTPELALTATRLTARLADLGSVLVAFSGGADSALLLAAAVRTLGAANVAAATAVSSSLPEWEMAPAQAFSTGLGVRHLWPRTDEMSRDGYRANAGDRCYFCKAELLDVLGPVARQLALAHVATGTNADDAIAGFRPGIRAAVERGAVSPLRDAGMSKQDVRDLSRAWRLPTWDKPAAACLSSRVAYGIAITPVRLARVEHAEGALRDGLRTFRAGRAQPPRPGSRRSGPHRDRRRARRCRGRDARGRRGRPGEWFRRRRGRPSRLPIRIDERSATGHDAQRLTARLGYHGG